VAKPVIIEPWYDDSKYLTYGADANKVGDAVGDDLRYVMVSRALSSSIPSSWRAACCGGEVGEPCREPYGVIRADRAVGG